MFLLLDQQGNKSKKFFGSNVSKVGGVIAGIIALKVLSMVVNKNN